ncbi:hypothetical protein ACFV6E_22905 [Streptomyces sp. NPDC059785]|uniref:hypothetical protein n=1 Tax=Streptomyces sp. NPDC059785 TaxID=3346945 RepID=UPI003655BBF6
MARRRRRLDALVEQLAVDGVEAAGFTADLSRPAEMPALIAGIRDRFGRIDVIEYGPFSTEQGLIPAARTDAAVLEKGHSSPRPGPPRGRPWSSRSRSSIPTTSPSSTGTCTPGATGSSSSSLWFARAGATARVPCFDPRGRPTAAPVGSVFVRLVGRAPLAGSGRALVDPHGHGAHRHHPTQVGARTGPARQCGGHPLPERLRRPTSAAD